MAAYTNVNLAKTATLVASTVDTVTFAGTVGTVTILNHSSSSVIYHREDGTAPTVAGDDCLPLLPGNSVVIQVRADLGLDPDQLAVKLISAGTPTYTVVGA